MMLCKLSLKNIKKSMKDYAIYFFTLILGVAIFYVFNAIDSQTVMLNINKRTYEIIKLMTDVLSGVSVFVAFVLGFLIIYASRFLMKRRNKEFAIYLTLGMSKRKISTILLVETILIGMVSLLVGLGVGIIVSQFMSVIVANMFEADLSKFKFLVSQSAIIKTIIYFAIMYLIVMVFNTISVSKCKLIDLLHSNKKAEKVKIKNPVICTMIFIVSAILLGFAYFKVTHDFDKITNFDEMFVYMGIGVVTTFTIFWSLSGLLIKIFMSLKKVYFKKLNVFTLRELSSKVNTTVFSMTIICLMLFITICVLSSALSLKNSLMSNLKELTPVDIELVKTRNISQEKAEEQKIPQEAVEDTKVSLKETIKNLDIDVSKLKDKTAVKMYHYDGVNLGSTLGSYEEECKKHFPYVDYTAPEDIMTVSDYNKVAKKYGKKQLKVQKGKYIIVADYDQMIAIRNDALKTNPVIKINGEELTPQYKKCVDGFVNVAANHINLGIFVVSDDLVSDDYTSVEILLANYKTEKVDKEQLKSYDEKFHKTIEELNYNKALLDLETKIDMYNASIGLGAMISFVSIYLGIIFLISSAAILALKELSESSDNKDKYQVLRKLGVSERTINKTLFTQIFIFFMFPLLLAIIHSIFGIMFANHILETFGNEKILESIIMTAFFIILIYGGYFLITYICSKKIIKD